MITIKIGTYTRDELVLCERFFSTGLAEFKCAQRCSGLCSACPGKMVCYDVDLALRFLREKISGEKTSHTVDTDG